MFENQCVRCDDFVGRQCTHHVECFDETGTCVRAKFGPTEKNELLTIDQNVLETVRSVVKPQG